MKTPTLLCAWASRHEPLPDQRAALAAAYRIVQVGDARDPECRLIWLDIVRIARAVPDLLVLITRHEQITPMCIHVARVAPQCVIVQPGMQWNDIDRAWHWSGVWKRLIVVDKGDGLGTKSTVWTPNPQETRP